jgi:hypothetical protein
MNEYPAIVPTTAWLALLSDKDELLKHPGLHHKNWLERPMRFTEPI